MKRNGRYVRQMPKIYGNLQEPKRDWGQFRRLLLWAGWLAAVAAVGYALFFSGWFAIRKVAVDGTHFVSADAVEALVEKGSSTLLFSKETLVADVLRDDRIDSVAVFRSLPDSIKISVQERKPAMLWISGESVTVLDENGIAFVTYPSAAFPTADTELGVYLAGLQRVTDATSLPVSLGSQVVSPAFVRFVGSVRQEMADRLPDAPITGMQISQTTYDLAVTTKPGLQVQFDTLGDAGVQVRNLARLIHQKKATFTSHVDLRIDRWAYVR